MSVLSSGGAEQHDHGPSVPLIIKRKKRGHSGGHSDGAWKIAYADFITAMMAFFLLMWILNVATDQQKKAIAQYFNPFGSSTHSSSQPHVLGGPSPTSGEIRPIKDFISPEIVSEPRAEEDPIVTERQKAEHKRRQETIQNMKKALKSDPRLKELEANIMIEEVPEGVRLQIADQDHFTMFKKGQHEVVPQTRQLLDKIAPLILNLPYSLAITGHTDAYPFHSQQGYDNWELSSDRALACRRALIDAGVPQERFHSVVGRADTELLVKEDPLAPQNRRISIVFLYPNAL